MMDLKTASPQEIAKYFSREVNNMFFKPDKIAEEQRGLQTDGGFGHLLDKGNI